jgi:uncharacterized protein (DUF1697 family)
VTRYVALMRGINVGGKKKLPMADLVTLFVEAGCRDVETYIQSGNVVYSATEKLASRVPDLIVKAVLDRIGFRAPVVTRTAAELRSVASANPFLRAGGADADELHVMFLAERPTPAKVSFLDPLRSPPDEFVVRGRDIYVRCPNGVARSKLTNDYFDRSLATTSTMRNWRTVLILAEMSARIRGRS